ncbi:outer membrane protein, partial [Bradyrhizobium sp.]|uniref:outer membrane protein n=1 Tax=Bradyrhizobium sp. TaxID=376 RepID=UPI003C7543C6
LPLGTIGLVALSGSAMAADLPARTYNPPPPIVATIYDWTGFYIGANGGWGSSRNCWGVVPLAGVTIADGCASRSGGLFGGQMGYRWQSGQFVFGLEGQGDWANLSGSRVSVFNPFFSTGVKVDAVGLFTGQIGYAWNASLLYLKGGAATTRNRFDVWTTASGVNVATASSNRWGGTVGVGWEYGFAPNWSAGIEYDHLFMGDSNNSFSVANPLLAGAANRISQDVDMVTLRVNYRFGGYTNSAVGNY